MERKFSRPAQGLERDSEGHRTGFKLLLKIKVPMSNEAFHRFKFAARSGIAKHKFVYRPYGSTTNLGYPNGVPIEYMKDDKLMGNWIIDNMYLQEGVYYLFGWTNGKTRTHVKITKVLAIMQVFSTYPENKFTITKAGRLNRYYFRKGYANKEKPMSEFRI